MKVGDWVLYEDEFTRYLVIIVELINPDLGYGMPLWSNNYEYGLGTYSEPWDFREGKWEKLSDTRLVREILNGD